MAGLSLLVLTNPVEGQEDEYNEWYTDRHLHDVLALDGVVAAQRFEFVSSKLGKDAPDGYRYLAIYEVDPDRREEVEKALLETAGGDDMPMSDAMAKRSMRYWFSTISDRVEAPVREQA